MLTSILDLQKQASQASNFGPENAQKGQICAKPKNQKLIQQNNHIGK